MKAKRVKGLDPDGALVDNAERIVRVRLAELHGFMPAAAEPDGVTALHDMRIAAKRLRYVLEVTHELFGPYAAKALGIVKDLQDLLGEIHDCDEQLPDVDAALASLIVADAATLTTSALAEGSDDLDPSGLADAPGRPAYAGVVGLAVHLRARRELLFARFAAMWLTLERQGFRPRLEFAIAEREPAEAIT